MRSVVNRGGSGGGASEDVFDVERLERSTRALAEVCERLQHENERLGRELSAREARIAELDAEILAGNARRADSRKRIDDLVARLEWVDDQLAKAAERSKGDGRSSSRSSEPAPNAAAPTPTA